MSISKNVVAGSSVLLSFHNVINLAVDFKKNTAVATVNSYRNEQEYTEGVSISWQWPVSIPVASVVGHDLLGALEAYLITAEDSPFKDGVVVSDPAETFADKQARKVEQLKAACQASILAGFTSDALGDLHLYPAKPLDQANLVASVTAALLSDGIEGWETPFWCQDEAGAWAFVLHTSSQIKQVGLAGKASILAALSKNELLASQALAATTSEELDAVEW